MLVANVAQLVEPRIVDPVVVGSSPIVRPCSGSLAQLVEQRTLNPRAKGSNPLRPMLRSVAHGLPSVLFSHHD